MYQPISLQEAIEKINKKWFLPAIQRPYVWGSRYESERYISKLFDSLYKRYPIGGIILWNACEHNIAHREFLSNHHVDDTYKNVDEGLWGREKYLVYDGQQRLQTIYSCLQYTFNDRILVFDLTYNASDDSDGLTGFSFVDTKENLPATKIKMNSLFSATDINKKIEFRKKACKINPEKNALIEENLEILWQVFVSRESRSSLAYYIINEDNNDNVNEMFERLNTGGIALSNSDLLYSRIKSYYPDFESEIMVFAKRENVILNHYDLLQLLHIAVKGRSRVGEKVAQTEIDDIVGCWNNIQRTLEEFFDNYLVGHLGITDISIVRNKQPLYIIILFLYYRNQKTNEHYMKIPTEQIQLLDKFFITAELNDWSLQSYIDNFDKILKNNNRVKEFPWADIESYVKNNGKREISIKESVFCAYPWFSLKILMPSVKYNFLESKSSHRANPEIDHIFPRRLKGHTQSNYPKDMDIIWNMQPIGGDINNAKRNHHPHNFFTNQKGLNGNQYFKDYYFCPKLNSAKWQDPYKFIAYRRGKMIDELKNLYDIKLCK